MGTEPLLSFIIPRRENEDISKTVECVKEACGENNVSFEIFTISGNNPTKQRNICLDSGVTGEFVYFLDNDSRVTSSAVAAFLKDLKEKGGKLGVLGGPNLTPDSDSFLQKNFGAVLGSFAAVGKISSRYAKDGAFRETDDSELILCNLIVRRLVFKECGKFNEKLYPNEENEFLERVKRAGLGIFYDPELFIYRSQRATLKAYCRQMFTYGRGRGEQTKIDPKSFKLFLLGPVFFFLYVIAALAALIFYPAIIILLPLVLYFIVLFISGLKVMSFAPLYPVLVFLAHFLYGAGVCFGCLKSGFKTDHIEFKYEVKKVE